MTSLHDPGALKKMESESTASEGGSTATSHQFSRQHVKQLQPRGQGNAKRRPDAPSIFSWPIDNEAHLAQSQLIITTRWCQSPWQCFWQSSIRGTTGRNCMAAALSPDGPPVQGNSIESRKQTTFWSFAMSGFCMGPVPDQDSRNESFFGLLLQVLVSKP